MSLLVLISFFGSFSSGEICQKPSKILLLTQKLFFSTRLEGFVLVALFMIISVSAFYVPQNLEQ